jgi:hypothetical protein
LVAPPTPVAVPSPCGHSSWPVPSVIVTFWGLSPFTEEAVSWAMPRTAPASSVSAVLPSMTAAVAVDCWSANRSSWGSTSWTVAFCTPCTWSIVLASWPSSARW